MKNPVRESEAIIEKVTTMGTVIRLRLEPLENEHVRILEYSRKGKHSQSFKRVKTEENKVIAYEQLKIEQSFSDLFAHLHTKKAA